MPVLFGDVQTSGLRGEGRREWEEGLMYGVKMNYMHYIGIAKIFFFTYSIPLYIYLGSNSEKLNIAFAILKIKKFESTENNILIQKATLINSSELAN